jgi:hypothetical protein
MSQRRHQEYAGPPFEWWAQLPMLINGGTAMAVLLRCRTFVDLDVSHLGTCLRRRRSASHEVVKRIRVGHPRLCTSEASGCARRLSGPSTAAGRVSVGEGVAGRQRGTP